MPTEIVFIIGFALGCLCTYILTRQPKPLSTESQTQQDALGAFAREPEVAPKRKRGRPRKVA